MTRAIEQNLYALMRSAQDLERQARETLSQAQSAHFAARKSFARAQAEWLNANEQLEAQSPAPLRAFALGGAR